MPLNHYALLIYRKSSSDMLHGADESQFKYIAITSYNVPVDNDPTVPFLKTIQILLAIRNEFWRVQHGISNAQRDGYENGT